MESSSVPVPADAEKDYVQDGQNKTSIYCTRCPSLILLPLIGLYSPDEKFDLPRMTQEKNSSTVQTDPVTECFKVEDILQFENIGFSHSQNNVKYLVCADCESGPLGWSSSDAKISYVAVDRVRFKL